MISIKRVYEPFDSSDGTRFLVERLWPRGETKIEVHMDSWLKEVAPSTELRKWFNHDPLKWAEFQQKYRDELKKNPEAWQPILDAAGKGKVTLLYSSHDQEHNNAVVLKAFLDEHLKD